jgi:hypothetical protein
VGRYAVRDTRVSADGFCLSVLGAESGVQFEIAEDSPGTFKWDLIPEGRVTIWEHGTIDASCQARLEWDSDYLLFLGADGQEEASATAHDVRTFRVDPAAVLSGTITRTVTPSVPYPGLPCTWTGASSG